MQLVQVRSLPLSGPNRPIVGSLWQLQCYALNILVMKIRQTGFTLIELLITVAIAAILLSLAAPNFRELLVKRSVQAAAETLLSDMRYARSEALKRSTRTVICRSVDGSTCTNVVGSWSDGWIVYVDPTNIALNTAIPADALVRVQQQLPNVSSVESVIPADTLLRFSYEPTGWAKNASTNFVVAPTGTVLAGSTRLVCVSINGRPALRSVGSLSCT